MAAPGTATEDEERGTLRWAMTNHRPTDEEIAIIERMREVFIAVGEQVERDCPASRERSLAVTKLEESLMWAVASIARNTENMGGDQAAP